MFVTFVLQTDSTRHVVTTLLLSHSKKSGTCLCSRATRVDHHSCTSTSTPSSRICLPTYTQIEYKLSTSAQHKLTTSKCGGLIDSVLRNTLSCSGRDLNPRPLRYRLSRPPIQRIDSLYRSKFYGYHFRDPHWSAQNNVSKIQERSPMRGQF